MKYPTKKDQAIMTITKKIRHDGQKKLSGGSINKMQGGI